MITGQSAVRLTGCLTVNRMPRSRIMQTQRARPISRHIEIARRLSNWWGAGRSAEAVHLFLELFRTIPNYFFFNVKKPRFCFGSLFSLSSLAGRVWILVGEPGNACFIFDIQLFISSCSGEE